MMGKMLDCTPPHPRSKKLFWMSCVGILFKGKAEVRRSLYSIELRVAPVVLLADAAVKLFVWAEATGAKLLGIKRSKNNTSRYRANMMGKLVAGFFKILFIEAKFFKTSIVS